MSILHYGTIIEKFFTELDLLLNSYIYQGYNALSHYLKYPLGLACTLYIIILGLAITKGYIKLSMKEFIKSTVKISLIYLATMNWSWFSKNIVALLCTVSGQIGDVLINATPIPLPHFKGEGINGAMQSVLIEFAKVGHWIWQTGSWHNISSYIDALLVWGFGYAIVIVAVFELVLAKIMLAVLLATAPLFVGFTLFKPTHGFFDKWLGACVGFALLVVFVSSILGFALNMAQWAIGGMFVNKVTNTSVVGFIPIILVGCIGVGIILKVAHLAQSIGGTVTTTSGSALLAGTVGGVMGAGLTSLKTLWGVRGGVGKSLGIRSLGAASAVTNVVHNHAASQMDAIHKGLSDAGAGLNSVQKVITDAEGK